MKTENPAFVAFDNQHTGIIFDDSANEKYPIKYFNVIDGIGISTEENKSYFGFVYDGILVMKDTRGNNLEIQKDMFFSFKGKNHFETWASGKAVIIEVQNDGYYAETNYSAYRMFGGPIEEKGRLKYIDGCTDSLLIAPIKLGDPCLNHLHFPSNIKQTPHTHPSHRIGIVASGSGTCITPFGNLPLTQGMIFVIKQWDGVSYSTGLDGKEYSDGTHCFNTQDEVMNVIAFHPDSDFGATDEIHPMINRTIVNGVPANQIEEIRTK